MTIYLFIRLHLRINNLVSNLHDICHELGMRHSFCSCWFHKKLCTNELWKTARKRL